MAGRTTQLSDSKELTGINRKAFLLGLSATVATPAFGVLQARAVSTGPMEIAPGIYVHQGRTALADAANGGDIANLAFIAGDTAVAVIDTGGSAKVGAGLRAAIKAKTDRPIHYVINTHMHPDHVLGNAAFEDDTPDFIAHHKFKRALGVRSESYLRRAREQIGDAEFTGTKIVMPTREITQSTTLDLGGRTLTLVARPTAHTDNDLTIFDDKTSTILTGDLLFSGHLPTLDGSIVGWLKLFSVLRGEKAERAVPGHGPASMPWPSALDPVERYWTVVATDVRAAIKDGKTISEAGATAGQSERGKWELFDEHHVRNVTAAFAELEWE